MPGIVQHLAQPLIRTKMCSYPPPNSDNSDFTGVLAAILDLKKRSLGKFYTPSGN